nr:hypothetical protein [uncultured Draconibacterium sp.]
MRNLKQASNEELTLYYQKARNLEWKGETLCVVGAAAGLVGILGGAALNDDCSSGGSGILCITAATLMTGGVAATIIGFTMYMTGISRIDRINKVQFFQSIKMEVLPGHFYSWRTKNYPTGITLRITF